jgi:hypothetical protein
MSTPIENVNDWRQFEMYARRYFSKLWGVTLSEGTVQVGGLVPWKFDLVSSDQRFVGDVKWFKNVPIPAAKYQAIAEYIWLLQKVHADKVFMVFGRDAEVAERYLKRMRPLTAPLEFYFLDGEGHRSLLLMMHRCGDGDHLFPCCPPQWKKPRTRRHPDTQASTESSCSAAASAATRPTYTDPNRPNLTL